MGNTNGATGYTSVSIVTVGPKVQLFTGSKYTSSASITFFVVFNTIVTDFLSHQALVSSALIGPLGSALPPACLQWPNASISLATPNQFALSLLPGSPNCVQPGSTPKEGNYSLYLPEGVSIDSAGNPSEATAPVTVVWLPYQPSVVVSSGLATNKTFSAEPLFIATFSHAVASFNQFVDAIRLASLNVQSLIISQPIATDFTTFNISVVAVVPGTVTLTIPAGITYDPVGNTNLQSNSFSISFATCSDGILNGDETSVDCGGSCPGPCPSCSDGLQNGLETGVDCGGPACAACQCSLCPSAAVRSSVQPAFLGQWALVQPAVSSKPQFARNSFHLYANPFYWYIRYSIFYSELLFLIYNYDFFFNFLFHEFTAGMLIRTPILATEFLHMQFPLHTAPIK